LKILALAKKSASLFKAKPVIAQKTILGN